MFFLSSFFVGKNISCVVWISLVKTPQDRFRITNFTWDGKGVLIGRVDPPPQIPAAAATTQPLETTSTDNTTDAANDDDTTRSLSESPLPLAVAGCTKPSKPPNRWILYRAHRSAELRAENPGMSVGEMSHVISLMWKSESAETKAEWEERAVRAREEHFRNAPEYAVASALRLRRRAAAKAAKKTVGS